MRYVWHTYIPMYIVLFLSFGRKCKKLLIGERVKCCLRKPAIKKNYFNRVSIKLFKIQILPHKLVKLYWNCCMYFTVAILLFIFYFFWFIGIHFKLKQNSYEKTLFFSFSLSLLYFTANKHKISIPHINKSKKIKNKTWNEIKNASYGTQKYILRFYIHLFIHSSVHNNSMDTLSPKNIKQTEGPTDQPANSSATHSLTQRSLPKPPPEPLAHKFIL